MERPDEGQLGVGWRTLAPGASLRPRDDAQDGASDLLLVVLQGEVDLTREQSPLGGGCGMPLGGSERLGTATRLDAVRLPASSRGRLVLTNWTRTTCTLLVVESTLRSLTGKRCEAWSLGDAVARAPSKPLGAAAASISPSSTLSTLDDLRLKASTLLAAAVNP